MGTKTTRPKATGRLPETRDVFDGLRAALLEYREAGGSMYALSEESRRLKDETGDDDQFVSQAQLSKIISGDVGLRLPRAQLLANMLGYEIVFRPKKAGR